MKYYFSRKDFDDDKKLEFLGATSRDLVYETARLALIGRRIYVKYYKYDNTLYPATCHGYNKVAKKFLLHFDDYHKDFILLDLIGSKADIWKFIKPNDSNYNPPKDALKGDWEGSWPTKTEISFERAINAKNALDKLPKSSKKYTMVDNGMEFDKWFKESNDLAIQVKKTRKEINSDSKPKKKN